MIKAWTQLSQMTSTLHDYALVMLELCHQQHNGKNMNVTSYFMYRIDANKLEINVTEHNFKSKSKKVVYV